MLTIAGSPDNLRGTFGMMVEQDMYDICARIKEVSDRLYIFAHEDGRAKPFSIMEELDNGKLELVYRTEELDARVISKVEYFLRVPFKQRFAEMERKEDEAKARQEAEGLDMLVEKIGLPMLRDLERCGFIQRGTSYSKRGMKFA